MIPILLYHSISDHPSRTMRRFTVSTAAFERHCQMIVASGRTPMTVSALVDGITSAAMPPNPVAVTFDCGFSDTLAAVSRLADAGFPATAFITTSWLGQPGMLTQADLVSLAARGIEIGGHGHTHRRLDELGEAELSAELTVCRRSLTAAIGARVTSFSYPHGSHDHRTRRAVEAAGYRCACVGRTRTSNPADDAFALGRLTVSADVGDERVAAWLDGEDQQRAPRGEPLPNRMWRQVRRNRRAQRTQSGYPAAPKSCLRPQADFKPGRG